METNLGRMNRRLEKKKKTILSSIDWSLLPLLLLPPSLRLVFSLLLLLRLFFFFFDFIPFVLLLLAPFVS